MIKKTVLGLITFLVFVLCLVTCSCVFAMPANPNGFTAQLTNGSTVEVFLNGDENFNYYTDKDGYVLIRLENGTFQYEVGDTDADSKQLYSFNGRPFGALKESELERPAQKSIYAPSSMSRTQGQPVINVDERPLLTIMIEFDDMKFSAHDDAFWTGKFYSETSNSVNKYYMEVSGGKQKFTPASESYGTVNDGLIRVSVNKSHPQPELSEGTERDLKIISCVYDAVTAANAYIDFSQYDTDGDGFLTNEELCISIIVAGYETSYDGNANMSVWAHQWLVPYTTTFAQYQLNCDNVYLLTEYADSQGNYRCQTYTMQGEQWKSGNSAKPLEIGVLCHELGHVLGLPDLYDTEYSGVAAQSVDGYCLMASGSWGGTSFANAGSLPTHICAFNKWYLGWYNPIDTDANASETFNVTSAASDAGYKMYGVSTDDNNEFFLIENRQFEGFDAGLWRFAIKGGIAIWHIDMDIVNQYFGSNTINVATHPLGVELERCGYSRSDMSVYDPLWHSGSGRYLTFSNLSVPNSTYHSAPAEAASADSGVCINVNSACSDTMSVSLVKPSYETVATIVNNILRVQILNYSGNAITLKPMLASFVTDNKLFANHIFADTTVAENSRTEFPTVSYTGKTAKNRLYVWDAQTMENLLDAYIVE